MHFEGPPLPPLHTLFKKEKNDHFPHHYHFIAVYSPCNHFMKIRLKYIKYIAGRGSATNPQFCIAIFLARLMNLFSSWKQISFHDHLQTSICMKMCNDKSSLDNFSFPQLTYLSSLSKEKLLSVSQQPLFLLLPELGNSAGKVKQESLSHFEMHFSTISVCSSKVERIGRNYQGLLRWIKAAKHTKCWPKISFIRYIFYYLHILGSDGPHSTQWDHNSTRILAHLWIPSVFQYVGVWPVLGSEMLFWVYVSVVNISESWHQRQ